MKEQKKGISLIVLVITIIVMIILASAVIITLSNSNIITKAKEAVLKTDVKSFTQELSVSLADKKVENPSLDIKKITETNVEEIKKYIPNFDEKYAGKIFIQNGELVYDASKVTDREKIALESIGIKSGTTYTPAEIKAIIEEKNLGTDVSTTDITTYVDGLSKKEAEKYTIFRGDLYYRYEKTTYEEQVELYNTGISLLMGDANADGVLTEEDMNMIDTLGFACVVQHDTNNIFYVCNNSASDFMVENADAAEIDYILNGEEFSELYILEHQNPERIKFIGDYVYIYYMMYESGKCPSADLTTTDYNVMKQYYTVMTEEQSEKFQIVDGDLALREDKLTEQEKLWADDKSIPYM